MMTTEHGFSLKSGFKEVVLTKNMVLLLNPDSQKYCLHHTFLYFKNGEIWWSSNNKKLLVFLSMSNQCWQIFLLI